MIFQLNAINTKSIMSFTDYFKIQNIYQNKINAKTQIYKYFSTQNDPYTYEEVYKYFKQYTKKISTINTFNKISLYAIHNNIKHKLFSKIIYGNTIKKDKFAENKTISPPFEVFISLEIYNIPVSFQQNTLKKALRPTFKFSYSFNPTRYNGTIEQQLFFYSQTIYDGTIEEIYNLSFPHIHNFQCIYKNYSVEDEEVTKTIYELFVVTGNSIDDCLYLCEINTEGDILEENKYNANIPPVYKLLIKVTLIHDPEFIQQTEEYRRSEIEELELRIENLISRLDTDIDTNKKCTKEETCCICLSAPTNIIFTNCGHMCICGNCDKNLTKCPLCRTTITKQKMEIKM